MSQPEKVCVFCGQSCAGQARIKDANGNYAHKACVEQKQAGQEDPGAGRDALHADEGLDGGMGGMDDLWDDLEPIEPEVSGAASGCPGCGRRMEPGTLVCMSCGFNTQTGKALKTKKNDAMGMKVNSLAEDSKLAEIGAGIAGLGLKPILPMVGAAIGGAIGAAIWAAIAYFTGYEMGYVAILVGTMCGYGARMGGDAETTGGVVIAGTMAVCVAILAIGAGKYVALCLIFERELGGHPLEVQKINIYEMDQEGVFANMAYDLCFEKINAGEAIAWENHYLPIELAEWPNDYPAAFQDEVYNAWDGMTDRDRLLYRRDISDSYGLTSYREVDIDWALQVLADELATVRIGMGEAIEWPDPHLYNEAAVWPDDYPQAIRDEVDTEWASLSSADQDARVQAAVDAHNEFAASMESFQGEFTYQLVLESFKRPIQVLFAMFAVGWAFWIGNSDS